MPKRPTDAPHPSVTSAKEVESLERRLEELRARMEGTFAELTERIAQAERKAPSQGAVPSGPLSDEALAERRKPVGELVDLVGAAPRSMEALIDALRQHDLEELRDGAVADLDRKGALALTLAAFNESGFLHTPRALRAIILTFSTRSR